MNPKSSLYEDKHRSSMKHESKKKVRNIRGRSSSYNSTKIDREKKRNRSRSRNRDEDREYKKDNYDTKTSIMILLNNNL